MKKVLTVTLLIAIACIMSCKKDNYDPGTTATPKTSNGWWVNLQLGGSNLVPEYFLSTYNTSANGTDSMWIDDLQGGYGFKCKTPINYTAQTFSTTKSANEYYIGTPAFPANVNIIGGKVLSKAGHSKTGVITDSIYFKAVFSDDPSDTFVIAGNSRTGIVADDY